MGETCWEIPGSSAAAAAAAPICRCRSRMRARIAAFFAWTGGTVYCLCDDISSEQSELVVVDTRQIALRKYIDDVEIFAFKLLNVRGTAIPLIQPNLQVGNTPWFRRVH